MNDGQKIDGLVYCVGVADIQPLRMLDSLRFEKSMAVNFYSFIEMVKLLSKNKYHNKYASIVAVSSSSSKRPKKCQSLYSASKAALDSAVHSLSIELASKNIRINAIGPGPVDTPMLNESFKIMNKEQIDNMISEFISGLTQPSEIANIIMFLLSEASRIITGRYIYACAAER